MVCIVLVEVRGEAILADIPNFIAYMHALLKY